MSPQTLEGEVVLYSGYSQTHNMYNTIVPYTFEPAGGGHIQFINGAGED